jgi:hypothetical protein
MSDTDADATSETSVQKSPVDEASDYGITTSQVTYYHYGVYRYTNLKDAIAEAKRDRAK